MNAHQYELLVKDYLEKRIGAEQFTEKFNSLFLAESQMDKNLFEILESIFEDGEAYSPMWTIQDENEYRITEATFQEILAHKVVFLENYIQTRLT